ncbi:MAG: AbrB/MazE/SpoVT family DNA-binding domain-containing protein [Rhizomicrobium sp.]
MESKITAKGQMTLPKEAREHMGIKSGSKVKIFTQPNGKVMLLPVTPVSALKGIVTSPYSRPVSIEEMDDAIRARAVARNRRASGK